MIDAPRFHRADCSSAAICGLKRLSVAGAICAALLVCGATTARAQPSSGFVTNVTASGAQVEQSQLPDDRAYELVSPTEKNGGDVGGESFFAAGLLKGGAGESSVSGSAIEYNSFASFGDAQGAGLDSQYLSSRGPSGWSTRAISPPSGPASELTFSWRYHIFTPELTAGIVQWLAPALAVGAPPEFENLYLVHDLSTPAYRLLTPGAPLDQPSEYQVTVIGASTDLSHVVFEANDALVAGAQPNEKNVYEWTEAGGLKLASVLPGPGDVAAYEAEIIWGENKQHLVPSAVSSSGARIFWTEVAGNLFVRENGTTTVQLNESQRTPSQGDGFAWFWTATPDGSKVFFTDRTALTNNPENESDEADPQDLGSLYEYDFADGKLTDLSPDGNGSPEVVGVVATSEDGTSVYFVAKEILAAGATKGQDNLYLARGATIKFIAALGAGDESDWPHDFQDQTALVTPDGEQLVFMSVEPLTGYDNTDVNTGQPDSEVFVYDAGDERLVCVSCNPSGEQPIGPSRLPAATELRSHTPRSISDNGERVFFDSDDALVAADTNGQQDVYEYENGTVHLISSATSGEASGFDDASANGDDVFFGTRAQLVPEDEDENADLYDARVGGSSPAALPSPEPCSGENCRGPLGAPLALLSVATEVPGVSEEAAPVQPGTVSKQGAAGKQRKRSSRKSKAGRRARKPRAGKPKRRHRHTAQGRT
jgi:hypothetical protein